MDSVGQVIGMGRGTDGQLGIGGGPSREVCLPRKSSSLTHVRVSGMSCGMAHSGVVTDTGTLLMFGKGKYGRLGSNSEHDHDTPLVVLVGSEQRVTGISCGAFHTGVVTAKGGLYMFGRGDSGQLGLDTTDHSFIPRLVSSISQKVTKLSCGVDHTICCTSQGALYGFGSNSKGQLGIGQSAQEIFVSPQRITYQSQDTNVSSTTFPSSLATGHSFTAMIADGCVYTWGQNDKGQCGTGTLSPSIWTPTQVKFKESTFATSVSCGLDHTLVVTESGRVYAWGSCEFGQIGMAPDLLSTTTNNKSVPTPFLVKEALLNETVVSSSCGSYHSVVVTVDGKLFSWGLGDKGQLGKIVEGHGIAPYPYHIRLKNIDSQSKDDNPRISVLAAGGRHTLAATYCKPHISVESSNFRTDIQRMYTGITSSNGAFFDVNNTCSFDAHRVFLCRAPKLYRMFTASSELQELSFPSVSRECMTSVLRYLYTNQIPSTNIDGFPSSEIIELAQDWGLEYLCTLLQVGCSDVEEGTTHGISRHLKKFVNNQEFSDVAFSVADESGNNVKIYAHKAILALRCEYFSVEFLGSFKESVQPVITITDTSPGAFLQLMGYLYTDEVAFQTDVVEVLTLSNLYQLEHLKTMCEKYIVEEVDVENAVALYEIAQQLDTKQLLAFCDYFIITQYDKVSKTEDFKVRFLASKQQHFSERHSLSTAKQDSGSGEKKCSIQ